MCARFDTEVVRLRGFVDFCTVDGENETNNYILLLKFLMLMKARFFAIAAMVLGLASCQRDFAPEANLGGEVDFRLEVSAPELGATRADADVFSGHNSAYGAIDYLSDAEWNEVDLRYTFEVYDEAADYTNAAPIKDRQVIIVDKYQPVTFETRLIPQYGYHFVVFADFVPQGATNEPTAAAQQDLGLRHVIGANLGDITIKADAINDEYADAYFATLDYTPTHNTHNTSEPIVLKRPYGKVRVVATDLAELNLNVEPRAVRVAYDAFHANAFNAVNGNIAGQYVQEYYDFEYADLFKDVEKGGLAQHVYTEDYDARTAVSKTGVERHTHMTLFTDYILAENQQNSINFLMTVYNTRDIENATAENIIKTTAFNTEIPVQRNRLTTIIGNVLTTAADIHVSIDDNFANKEEEAPYYVEIWDGESKNPAKFDAETNTYYVARASELAWIAEQVNTGNNFAGATVKVIAPIELNCEYWTPIGYGDNGAEYYTFNGTFDGGDWTIANLCIRDESVDYCNGLFGMTENATIKNVELNGVIINTKGGDVAALVGAINGTTVIENIAVSGLVQIDTDMASAGRVGAIVGGGWTSHNVALNNISVNVNEGSYVKANTLVGGVAGQILGVTTMTDIYSNIDVYSYNSIVGGIVGLIQHNSVVDGCVADGDVYRENAEGRTENQYKRIGGIAGSWENSVGKVVLNNVKFNGELISPDANGNAMTSFDYATYVGREYTTSKTVGELWINGVKFNYDDRNRVSVVSDETYDAAAQFNKITMYVDEAFEYSTDKTNGPSLEVYGKSVVVEMNDYQVKTGSASNYGFNAKDGSDVTIDNANFYSYGGGVGVTGGSNVVFNGGTVYVDSTSTSGRYVFYLSGNSTLTINDGNFSWNSAKNNKRAYIYANAGSTVYVYGGTFGKASTRSDYKAGILGDGEVIIYGGTFGFDPTAWVAEGYQAVKVGSNWVVSAI